MIAGGRTAPDAAWGYDQPTPAFAPIAGYVAFYAGPMDACTVDDEPVIPQPGGFYGGWITDAVTGPFKGAPGTARLVTPTPRRLSAMATTPAAPVEALAAVRRGRSTAPRRHCRVRRRVRRRTVAAPGMDRRPPRSPTWPATPTATPAAPQLPSRASMVDQYPGGATERDSEIEAGAGRSAAALLADLAEASGTDARGVGRRARPRLVQRDPRRRSGRERRLDELPGRRWLEVEVHLVDLGCGPTHRDWSDVFVGRRLPEMRAGSAGRLAAGDVLPAPGTLDARDELAWLYGRLARADLPVLGAWS